MIVCQLWPVLAELSVSPALIKDSLFLSAACTYARARVRRPGRAGIGSAKYASRRASAVKPKLAPPSTCQGLPIARDYWGRDKILQPQEKF
jgi:hypothetical protein